MFLERYTPNFNNLDLSHVNYLAQAVQKRYPSVFIAEQGGEYESGEELLHHCDAMGFDQADVIMSLANDPTPTGVVVIETLLGKPITRVAPKVKRTKTSKPRGPAVRRTDPRIITHVEPNPKRQGSASYARYEHYKAGMSVEDAIAAGLTMGDIRHDESKGFIKLAAK